MKPDKWTQQLHDKLAEHETPAPADLWADIEAALPQQPRRARFVALRRWAAAASVAVLLGGGALVWFGKEKEQHELMASMTEGHQDNMLQDEELSYDIPEDDGALDTMLETEEPHGAVTPRRALPLRGTTSAEEAEGPRLAKSGIEDDRSVQPRTEEAHVVQSEAEDVPVAQQKTEETHVAKLPLEKPAMATRPRKARHQPALSLYAMNGLSSQDNSNPVQMADALANSYIYVASQSASRQPTIWLAGFEERQHHRQPVAFGLTLSYPVTGRLSLVSGVVYTRLKSDFTQFIRSQHIFKEQTLHYVGIPLSASYRLWQYKGLKTYLSAGMQADWNVKAQLKTEGVEQEMGLDRLQWSVNASLGLQYDLLPQLSLYAEPGINHYFDNGSLVQNFFKDKPTSLKLQLGIRLNLQ
jgi:hypothetical protein